MQELKLRVIYLGRFWLSLGLVSVFLLKHLSFLNEFGVRLFLRRHICDSRLLSVPIKNTQIIIIFFGRLLLLVLSRWIIFLWDYFIHLALLWRLLLLQQASFLLFLLNYYFSFCSSKIRRCKELLLRLFKLLVKELHLRLSPCWHLKLDLFFLLFLKQLPLFLLISFEFCVFAFEFGDDPLFLVKVLLGHHFWNHFSHLGRGQLRNLVHFRGIMSIQNFVVQCFETSRGFLDLLNKLLLVFVRKFFECLFHPHSLV